MEIKLFFLQKERISITELQSSYILYCYHIRALLTPKLIQVKLLKRNPKMKQKE